jgi:hypothetical protein
MTELFGFEGSLNDLQQALTETIRQRIQAENRLNSMDGSDEWKGLQTTFVELCKSWEDELSKELIERIPKDQQVLS